MNQQEYMAELRQRLGPLPLSVEDIDDAIQFYEEYFQEAGPEREQDVIAELGSPAYVAAQIALKLSSSPTPLSSQKGVKFRMSTLKVVVLGILASPVALPLAFAAALTILSLLLAAACVVFAFGGGGLVCMGIGAGIAVYAAALWITSTATSLYFIGVGLVTLGVGGLMARFGWWLGKLTFKAITRVSRHFFRRSKREHTVSRTAAAEGRLWQ